MLDHSQKRADENWVAGVTLDQLSSNGRRVFKSGKKQIVVFQIGDRVFACNNRCPHQGFPLVEGDVSNECVLTCNWHNWKFDLSDGSTLVGGDTLRSYPTRVDGQQVYVDISDPLPEQVIEKALDDLHACFDRHEYDRMAREITRLQQVGGDPLMALKQTILWTYERFEYGTTHAVAAAADWLAYRDAKQSDTALGLGALLEAVGHFAWDSRRESIYEFTAAVAPFQEDAFVDAIEHEDQDTAISMVRGAFEAGLDYVDLHKAFSRAALAHYQNFGHALIYVYKTGQLIDRLDDRDVSLALSLLLTRSLIFASREDLIPEFKDYAPALDKWNPHGNRELSVEEIRTERTSQILDLISKSGGAPETLYDTGMQAAAWQMLHFDLDIQNATDGSVSNNANWLDFTHTFTFGNAVRKTCEMYPELWPQGLLQVFCFLGRNSGFVDATISQDQWSVSDVAAFVTEQKKTLIDHGQFEYIVSCHVLKLLSAFEEEAHERPASAWLPMAAASINRFLNEPLKRKHVLRTAKQAISFIEREG